MAKSTDSSMMKITPVTMILLVVAILFLAYILVNSLSDRFSGQRPEPLKQSSDLNGASDSLDAVNVDSVDSGLNDLNVEISRY